MQNVRRLSRLGQRISRAIAIASALFAAAPLPVKAQEAPLAWDQTPYYQYNILSTSYDQTARRIAVVFSVTNPQNKQSTYDILNKQLPFLPPTATLRVNVGWNTAGWKTTELVNTGSLPGGELLNIISRNWMTTTPPGPGGIGPSYPNVVNALTAAQRCSTLGSPCGAYASSLNTFFVTSVLPKQAVGSGRVAIEGHPIIQTGVDSAGQPVYANIPVKAAYQDFLIDRTGTPRRDIVDISKCKVCHDGNVHGDTVVPRLSLHGGNRTEELRLCVICHNPNQTDAAYRSSGAEQSVDFKRLVHGIHAGGMRQQPLVIVGFRGAVSDFSSVRFPGNLRNCVTCHNDSNGKGTFELPVPSILGSTINSGSVLSPLPGSVNVDPSQDLKISPIAAACSACHDDSQTRTHMTRMGASFGATQSALAGKEQCATCHGPGRKEDVRKVHLSGD